MTTTRTLTDAEQWAIGNALRAAAELYASDAASYRATNSRLARQFEDQATAARKLADTFEGAEAITIKGDAT
jgi:hypothetical protein